MSGKEPPFPAPVCDAFCSGTASAVHGHSAPKHRSRRERRGQAGSLIQIDASPHDWLEGRGPRLTLFAAIDDATGAVLALLFRAEEDAHGYFLLVRMIVMTGCVQRFL